VEGFYKSKSKYTHHRLRAAIRPLHYRLAALFPTLARGDLGTGTEPPAGRYHGMAGESIQYFF